jgi:hypothetical protein
MFRSIFIPVAVLLSIAPPAYGQNLPPTYHWPRDRESWHAEQRRLNGNLVMLFPELKDSFELMKSRLASVTGGIQVCDAERAQALLRELYIDYGDPLINLNNQGSLLGFIGDMRLLPAERFTPEGRAVLVAGLLEYARKGGGRTDSDSQVHLSRALSCLAPENPEALDLALDLANDAAEWVEAVDAGPVFQEFVQKNLEQMPGEDVWLQLYERTSGISPKAPPQRYRDALKALADVLEKNTPPDELERRLRTAGKAATADCGDAELNGDLLCRLLIVYRCVLQRRPPVARSCAEFIDWDLVRLARGDVKSATQWDLWSQAAVKLGPERFSERMRDCVRELVAQKAPPAEQRAALTRLATLTSRSQDRKRR